MEINSLFSTLAFAVSISAIAPYIWSVYRGKTEAPLSTWISWTAMNVAILAGIISTGEMSWQVAAFIVGNASVVAASLLRGAKLIFTKLDIGCMTFTLFAIVLWAISGNPVIAVSASVAGLAVASIPLIIAVWKNPETQVAHPWAIFSLGSIFAILAVTTPSIITMLPPVFFLSLQMLIVILISRKFIR